MAFTYPIHGVASLQQNYATRPRDEQESIRRIHRVSRQIAKLPAHSLIAMAKNSRLYRLAQHGINVIWAAIRFRESTTGKGED